MPASALGSAARACAGRSRRVVAASARCPKAREKDALLEAERRKARLRAKVEHPFRVIKRPVRADEGALPGLGEEHRHLTTLFALSNLWMARRRLLAMGG
jgi:IS5 family transposase